MTSRWPGMPFPRGGVSSPGGGARGEVSDERGHLERNWQVLDVVRKIAEQRGISMGQVAIAWVLGRPAVTSVILGARTLDQLSDNLAAGDMRLGEDETRLLDEASEPDTPDYPYGEKGQMQRSRRISGGRF